MIWQVSYKNFAYLDIKKVFKKVPKMAMNKNGRLVQHLSSVENVHRTNSLAIDLSTIYGRDNMPTKLELFKFVHKQLNLKAEELVDCQNHPFMPLFFVKVKNETILTRTEAKLAAGVKVFGRNLVLYGWRCDIPLTTVRINGANPDTSKDKVVATMSKYGAVTVTGARWSTSRTTLFLMVPGSSGCALNRGRAFQVSSTSMMTLGMWIPGRSSLMGELLSVSSVGLRDTGVTSAELSGPSQASRA